MAPTGMTVSVDEAGAADQSLSGDNAVEEKARTISTGKVRRMIDWNHSTLTGLLKHIVARRNTRRSMQLHSLDADVEETTAPDLLDCQMPPIEEVKDISPHTPVILLTAHGFIDQAVEAMQQGAHDFVLKQHRCF